MTQLVKESAEKLKNNCKIIMGLEGGYNVINIAKNIRTPIINVPKSEERNLYPILLSSSDS